MRFSVVGGFQGAVEEVVDWVFWRKVVGDSLGVCEVVRGCGLEHN